MDTREFCASCNTEFQPTRKLKKYCSKDCQISGKRKFRKLYKQKLKLNIPRATESQTDIVIENVDKQNPSVFDASDLVRLFSDWERLVLSNHSATGRVLKYAKNNDCWSLLLFNEVWTLQQWSEWLSTCQSQDVAYILTGVEVNEYCMEQLLKNDALASFATGGKYCLSHYSKERKRFCINLAPPWGQKLIWQWQGENVSSLSIFFVAHGSGTVLFTCFPQKTIYFYSTFRSLVKKYNDLLEISDTSPAMHVADNSQDWEEKLLEELAEAGIFPSSVEIAPGQGIIIPSEQPFWYKYRKESASNGDPLILISGHGDYVGPTTESFQARFWGLLNSPSQAEDSLFHIIHRFCQAAGDTSLTARNHVTAALHLFAKLKHKDEEREKMCTIAQKLLNQQPSLVLNNRSCKEDSSVTSGHNETGSFKSDRNKRKNEIDRDTSEQPPLKKFRSNYTRTISTNSLEDKTFSTYIASRSLPESIAVLPVDTWKSQPPNLVDSVKNKKYAIIPVLDRCSLIIFVDLHNYLTEKSPSCSILYCNSLCQRLKKTDIVNFLSSYKKTKPSWSSIKLARINDNSIQDRSLSTSALIEFLELFASKPFARKEDMTKEDKKKWRKRNTISTSTADGQESVDTENDDDM